ncbi:MAG: DNA glycosylase [Clostridia bacterium]|nr:DNA glycosylase [Clostridia bacterium]
MSCLLSTPLSVRPFVGEAGEPCLTVDGVSGFDVGKTFDCGQCFRFDPVGSSAHRVEYGGVINGRYVTVAQDEPHALTLHNVTEADFDGFFRHYLTLDTDYRALEERILATVPGEVMERAVACGSGIRILRQEGFETLCSFILSQNNNIPRIKKLIEAICRAYGRPFTDGYGLHYAFPSPEELSRATEAELRALSVGFRAPYLVDAARKWAEGQMDPLILRDGDYETAEAMLTSIRGVGPKVAACTLLFGFGHTEAFPVDVWIKKVLNVYFGGTFPVASLGDAAGLAQQYLFYLGRYSDRLK